MKTHRLTLLPIFSLLLLFTLSHALHFHPRDLLTGDLTSTVDVKPDHHHDSPSDGSDSKILLPSQPALKPDVVEDTKVPGSAGFMNLDIGPIRHPVHLRNRFPFPRVLRFFPRRCHHHHHHNHRQQEQRFFRFERPDRRFDDGVRFGPGRPREADQDVVGLMFKKNGGGPYAEIVRQRHVSRENVVPQETHRETAVQEPTMIFGQFKPMHPLDPRPRPHHHHHHHRDHNGYGRDEVEDRRVEMKREKEEKSGDDGEEEREKEKHHDHDHDHDHHRRQREEERENGLMKKIRKFLVLV